jgi:hypothetical protein
VKEQGNKKSVVWRPNADTTAAGKYHSSRLKCNKMEKKSIAGNSNYIKSDLDKEYVFLLCIRKEVVRSD